MKKFFEEAEIEVVSFSNADVITTSEDVDVSDSVGFDSGYEDF